MLGVFKPPNFSDGIYLPKIRETQIDSCALNPLFAAFSPNIGFLLPAQGGKRLFSFVLEESTDKLIIG